LTTQHVLVQDISQVLKFRIILQALKQERVKVYSRVPVSVPVPVPDPVFSTVFNTTKFVQNLVFSMLAAALLPRKLATNFCSFTFILHFMWIPGPDPVPEPECITVPVPLRQKVAVPATVPQH
jgi:hypothetical protein